MDLLVLTMTLLGLTFGVSRLVEHRFLRPLGAPTVRAIILGVLLATVQHALIFGFWAMRPCSLAFSDRLTLYVTVALSAVVGLALGFSRSSLASAMLWRSFVVTTLVVGVLFAVIAYLGLNRPC